MSFSSSENIFIREFFYYWEFFSVYMEKHMVISDILKLLGSNLNKSINIKLHRT